MNKPNTQVAGETAKRQAMDLAQQVFDTRRALEDLLAHWDEHSDANKMRQIRDILEEIL